MTNVNDIKNDEKYIPCLDHGFVGLVDSMGTDDSIVQAARVSYGKGTKKVSEDRGLIRYLLRHKHTTPFEMVDLKFHCKMPIFVARQWVRHRTSSTNEYSARYSLMSDEFYIPDPENLMPQSKDNKQGRAGEINQEDKEELLRLMKTSFDSDYRVYQALLGDQNSLANMHENGYEITEEFDGIARESARSVLPVANYTEWYWKINLHNLFHFIKLRLDPHAQYEIRVYAQAMYDLIKPIVPVACEAFEDYILKAESFSRMEMNILKKIRQHGGNIDMLCEEEGLSKREIMEFKTKLGY